MQYRAFLSYSHADSRWARWLHRGLEGYRVPSRLRGGSGEFGPLPDRLTPIFRDREDLSSSGELGPRIESALADSEALLVVCSPESARSKWVNDEILKFKRTGRIGRIYCLIVEGAPNSGDERECFAPALRFELNADGSLGTTPAEPIAADVRHGKDGKSLARLKLLSGLLGIPLDTLRQREAARRHRRLLAITALALLVMLVTSYLAVQAVIAQRAAERRQKQAEALVDFMLGDLTDKLSEVSRLDILEAVDNKAMAYFRSLPTTDVTDESLAQRAKALERIGDVRRDQGHLPQALQAYRAAAELTLRLAKARPQDVERQMAYAYDLTYIGTAHWYQGELDQAQASFEAAQAVLNRARKITPQNADLLYQLAGVDNNVGHVLESRGRLDEAMTQYRNMLEACAHLAAQPGNADWLVYLGLAHNNLAKMALLGGDLTTAITEYRADLAIESDLAAKDPQNNSQAEKVVISTATLGRTLALTGAIDDGVTHLHRAVAQAGSLKALDPSSMSFQDDFGLYATQLARLLRISGDLAGAGAMSAQSLATLQAMVKQDPGNTGWQRELAEALIEQAEQSFALGRLDTAGEQSRSALAIMETQLARQAEDRATVLATISARLLVAATSADAAAARQLRELALQSANRQSSGKSDPRLLALQVQALLALERKPEAISLLPSLWKTGYRDPGFLSLLSRHQIAPPPAPIGD
jgi:tetratricopeptide (TPR) repeat protein